MWSLNGQWCILKYPAQTGCWCHLLHSGIWTSCARNPSAPGCPLAFVHRWKQEEGRVKRLTTQCEILLNFLQVPANDIYAIHAGWSLMGWELGWVRGGVEGVRPRLTPRSSWKQSCLSCQTEVIIFFFRTLVKRPNIITGIHVQVWVIIAEALMMSKYFTFFFFWKFPEACAVLCLTLHPHPAWYNSQH